MKDIEIIKRYFPELTAVQCQQFEALYGLYEEWNSKINVISRKDFDQLYVRHVLHSLAIAKVCQFSAGARVMDVGCGGGFPGVPLAILFPEARFALVDSIGKKIAVVQAVVAGLGLTNVLAVNGRAEQVAGTVDYVVSRAVTDMSEFVGWIWGKVERGKRGTLHNGILCLKGGDLTEELAATGKKCELFNISDYFEQEFFQTKQVVYIRK